MNKSPLSVPKLHQVTFVYTQEEDSGIIFFNQTMYHAGYFPCKEPHKNSEFLCLVAADNKITLQECEIIVQKLDEDWYDIAYYPQPWGAYQMMISQKWFEGSPLI